VVAKKYAAATRTPSPARQTGSSSAVSRREGTACVLTLRLLPGELVGDRIPGELSQECRNQHQDGYEGDQLWLPLQHPVVPPRRRQTAGFSRASTMWRITREGDLGDIAYEAETRPASASGRRP